jgi:flagellar hook-associated protein 3 FlgL
MVSNVVSLITQTNMIQRNNHRIQQQMRDRGFEVSTGKKADLVANLRGEVRNYMDLKSVHNTQEQRKDRLVTAGNRMATMQNSLESVRNQTAEVLSRIEGRAELSDSLSIGISRDQASSAMNAIAMSVNVSWGGRTLFSGDAVDEPALENVSGLTDAVRTVMQDFVNTNGTIQNETDLNALFDEIATIFDETNANSALNFSNIAYTGGSGTLPGVEMIENEVMQYGIKANNETFREVFKGLGMLSATENLDQLIPEEKFRIQFIQKSTAIIHSGQDAVVNEQSVLGHKEQRIQYTTTGMDASIHFFETRIGEFENADAFESATSLQALQIQLESSFYVTAQLTRQSLLDYMR